jgi:hypothetical protein
MAVKFTIQAPQEQVTPSITIDATQPDLTPGQVPLTALKNLPKSTVGVLGGLYNMVRHPVDTLDMMGNATVGALEHGADYLGLKSKKAESLLSTSLNDLLSGKVSDNSEDKARKTASAVKQFAENRYGSGQKILNTVGNDPTGALLDLSTVLTMGGPAVTKLGGLAANAGEGSKIGQLGNVVQTVGTKAAQVGQKINPINIAVGAVSKPVKAVKAAVVDPLTASGKQVILGNLLKTAAGSKAKDVYDNLVVSSQKEVPHSGNTEGYQRSTAEVANNSGITSLEKAIVNKLDSGMAEYSASQRQLLADKLKSIAKTPEERAAVKQAIQEKAKVLYEGPKNAVVKADDVLNDLMSRDAMKPALSQAQKIASNKGESLQMTPAVTGGEVKTGLLDASGNPIVKTVESQPATYTGKTLQTIDKGLKEHIGSGVPGSGGIPTGELRQSALGVADALKAWMAKNLPGYADANAAYTKMMPELNTMNVADYLYKKLTPSSAEYVQKDADPAKMFNENYTKALQDPLTPKNATGWTGATMENSVTPEALATFENIAKDASHRNAINAMAQTSGSDTAKNLMTNNMIRQAGLPGWATDFPLISKPLDFYNKLWSGKAADLQAALPELMKNPEMALQAMKETGIDHSALSKAIEEFTKRAGQAQSVQQISPSTTE